MRQYKHKTYGCIATRYIGDHRYICYHQNLKNIIPSDMIENSNDWEEIKKTDNMKTTKQTIEVEVPEGYKVEGSCTIMDDRQLIITYLKKKEVKDFNWYYCKYFGLASRLNEYISREGLDTYRQIIEQKGYTNIPLEFKIGLFKFICDDLDIQWVKFFDRTEDKNWQITDICPKEFLNSLFK